MTNPISPEIIEKSIDTDFEALLDTTFADTKAVKGTVVKGLIVAIEGDSATIDIGMKAEGRVRLSEFVKKGDKVELQVGDKVDVYIENLDDRHGEARLSHEKALREGVMEKLEAAHVSGDKVEGVIFGKVKGGFAVDLDGILAFLPGSQVDVRPIRDIDHLMNQPQEMAIIKMDRKKGNIIVSRRAIMDEISDEDREEALKDMQEGKILDGVVKNITDYGAFVDLGGVDGLLHITDIAWHRINHPSEVLKMGESIKVQVIRFDEATKRVSLGIKQMNDDPWKSIEKDYAIGSRINGEVTNVTDYGAFVALAPGVEGLIHVSEMSWTRKNTHPNKIVSVGEKVDVTVLEIDREKRRISLGLKQNQENPWSQYASEHKEGDVVEGVIRSMTDFGIFVGLTDDIDGLIHISDLSWEKSGEEAMQDFKKGDTVKAAIIALDPEKERVALGLKQMDGDPLANFMNEHKKGDTVTVKVAAVEEEGIQVEVAENVNLFIKKRDLGVSREAQEPTRFKEGEEISVKITAMTKKDRKISLSIRALEVAEEKEAIAAYATHEDEGSSQLAAALEAAMGDKKKKDK